MATKPLKATSNLKMKSKGNNIKEEKEKVMELAAKIDETDEMKLKMLAGLNKPDPDDAIYPAELNAHLIEQLKVDILVSQLAFFYYYIYYISLICK